MQGKVWSFIDSKALISSGQTIGCALSGGADSVALFVCLHELAAQHGFSVCAVHVDHGIRGAESDRDARFVEELCRQKGVPLYLHCTDVPGYAAEKKVGLELAARELRYQFFEELHRGGIVDAVATAHHMEDNAETLLLHMVRGCGLEGLSGIQPKRGFLIRPFLCLGRGEIREYLDKIGQPWVEDSSNGELHYSRNYLRHKLWPLMEHLNPQAAAALTRLAESASRDLDFITLEAEKAEMQAATCRSGSAEIGLAAFRDLHEAVAMRLLRLVLSKIGRQEDVEYSHLAAVRCLAETGRTGASLDLGGGWQAEVCYGRLRLGRRKTAADPAWEEKLNLDGTTQLPSAVLRAEPAVSRGRGDGWSEYLDRDRIPEGAVVRTRRPGDFFRPLHGSGTKKLKDYFIDIKLPREEREAVPLLADGPRVLWVIGRRLSQDVAVGDNTERIVHLCYEERNG